MTVRLVVADSNTMVLVGYAAAVREHPDIHLAGQAVSAYDLLVLAATVAPDVILLDTDTLGTHRRGGPGPEELANRLRAGAPERGIVLVGPADDELLFQALEAGLSAYLPRSASVPVFLSAVRHAAVAPRAFTAPDLASALTRRRAASASLSPREIEVLRHLHAGSTNAGIAGSMRLTESTVRTYLARTYDKLGVRTRAQALVAATERGLL